MIIQQRQVTGMTTSHYTLKIEQSAERCQVFVNASSWIQAINDSLVVLTKLKHELDACDINIDKIIASSGMKERGGFIQ